MSGSGRWSPADGFDSLVRAMKRGSRRERRASSCGWFGPHSEDPTPVTLLDLSRTCGHDQDLSTPVPTCSTHLAAVESTDGVASVRTPCSVCGVVSAPRVVDRAPARGTGR